MDSVKWFEAVTRLAKERGITYKQASKEIDTMAKYICGGAYSDKEGICQHSKAAV